MSAKRSSVRLKDRRQRESYVLYGVVFVLVSAALVGTAYVTRLPDVTISSISVTGAVHVDVGAVSSTVEAVLDGSYALVVPKRMSYVVPQGAVAAAVVHAFPGVESVQVERTSTRSLLVRITERTPHALWCAETCYRMDAYGLVFAPAEPKDIYRVYEGGALEIGQIFLSGDFQDFDRFVTLAEGLSPSRIPRVRIDGTDAFLYLENGGEVRVMHTADPESTAARLEAIFTSNSFEIAKTLEYVELRFGNKALVKYRE